MTDYKNKLGGLADKLKMEQPIIPIQEVHPVKPPAINKDGEAQLNVWIPKTLLKRIKTYGIEKDLSLKDISILSLESYLSLNRKENQSV